MEGNRSLHRKTTELACHDPYPGPVRRPGPTGCLASVPKPATITGADRNLRWPINVPDENAMPFVACPCGKKFRATDALAGKQIQCPGCGRPLLIPQASLLDEELDRPQPVVQNAAPLSHPHAPKKSFAVEGWLLLAMVLGGGVVLVAVLMVFLSMVETGSDQTDDEQSVAGMAAQPDDSQSSAELAYEPEAKQPELEATPPTDVSPSKEMPPESTGPTSPQSAPAPSVEASGPSQPKPSRDEPSPPPSRPSASTDPWGPNTIRLSAGVALAQTLPTGTAMGFSVDYQFTANQPTGPIPLLWVIQDGKGHSVKQPVQMASRGTLQGFVTQFRPEHGPFNCHIEDKSSNRLSKSIALR